MRIFQTATQSLRDLVTTFRWKLSAALLNAGERINPCECQVNVLFKNGVTVSLGDSVTESLGDSVTK